MQRRPSSRDAAPDEARVVLAELRRLQRRVRDVGQQIDRIEAEMQRALSDLARERSEGYR